MFFFSFSEPDVEETPLTPDEAPEEDDDSESPKEADEKASEDEESKKTELWMNRLNLLQHEQKKEEDREEEETKMTLLRFQ